MKLPLALALMCVSLASLGAIATAAETATPSLISIFNGHDLTGWKAEGAKEFWRVEHGVLVGENNAAKAGNMLWTEKNYGDFVLEFDVRWQGEIDSGVEIRKPSIQLQLGVSRSLKRDMTGSFYVGKPGYPEAGQAKEVARFMKPEGQWNSFRLEARGATFTVWINGHQAAHYTDEKFSGAAPLGLQIHGGLPMKVEYKNLRAVAW